MYRRSLSAATAWLGSQQHIFRKSSITVFFYVYGSQPSVLHDRVMRHNIITFCTPRVAYTTYELVTLSCTL